ncbi:MAG TPA: DegT/DnrJ/EryC1/StrS family aminotransferase [Methylomirabilota bacterium]|nr:DegT/DnrJ/EryC1/StrS family aminotransferase [Methylomirabilota bacterium]
MRRQPFVDLAAQYEEVRETLLPQVERLLAAGAFIGGEPVARFEATFAAFCGVGHAVGVGNGTDALHLALRALEIGPGDEVITAANTFVATVGAIVQAGARPVLVDVRPDTLLMDASALETARTPATRAVIPVHLYGRLADMEPIVAWCARHRVTLLEDAAQAHGATRGGRRAGAFGDAAGFSFYPAKNLGAAGDAGAVVTDRPDVADRLRRLRDHGQTERYQHAVVGVNSRLDALQAVVLAVKLERLAAWNARRQALAALYHERLAKVPAVEPLPAPAEPESHVYHLFVVRSAERDQLRVALAARGIDTGLHYPIPVHLQPGWRHLGHREGDFPVTEAAARSVLSLPIYPHMSVEAVHRVCDAIEACA